MQAVPRLPHSPQYVSDRSASWIAIVQRVTILLKLFNFSIATRLSLVLLLLSITIFVSPEPAIAELDRVDAHWYSFTTENGLAGNIVQAIWEDPSGESIWFGTENGVSRYDGRTWTTYRREDGLADNNVWSISGDAQSVWCATSNGVSVFRDGIWTSYSAADGLPGNDIRAVLASDDGIVWVGSFGGGIGLKRPDAERWELFRIPARLDRATSFVQAIWQSADGAIWFSTNSFGALRLRDQRIEQFSFRVGSRNTVWSVGAEAESNTTWLATFRGIARIDPGDTAGIVEEVVQGVTISTTEVLSVAGGAANDLWFGTRAVGVFHYADGTWQRYTTADGLGSNYVQSILVDQASRVWFGTRSGGVTMLDRQPLPPHVLQPQIRITDIQRDSVIPSGTTILDYSQNNLRFAFDIDAAWLPPQEFSVRYWIAQQGQDNSPSPKLARSAPTLPAQASIEASAQANTDAFIALRPGSYVLHAVPHIGDIAGEEQQYAFTIRSAPPTFAANALSVTIDDKSVEQGWALPQSLFDDARLVQLAFQASDDTTADEQLQYRYRHDGALDWQFADGSLATVALPQGQHQLEVQAIDVDGNSSEPVMVTIIVPTPLWTTILVYLTLILVPSVIGGLAGALGYRRWARYQALRRAVSGYVIPYDVGPLITVPDRYIGRRHILDTILGKIPNNSFYIWGEKRIGKTSLLLQLKQRLLQRNDMQDVHYFIPVFRNIQDLPQQQFWYYLVRSITAELPITPDGAVFVQSSEVSEMGYDDFDAESDLELLLAQVQAQCAPRRVCIVLLLDEIDTLQRYDSSIRQRFRAFCQHTQRYLRVVLAGVHPPRGEAVETSPWYNIFEPVTLGPLAQVDTLTLIRHYNHNPYRYFPSAEQAIVRMGDGKPFDTQWLCSEAVKAMLAAQRTIVTLEDVEQAVRVVASERSYSFAAAWQQASPAARDNVCQALRSGGLLPTDHGIGNELVEAGLALKTNGSYRLARLFQHWLSEHHTTAIEMEQLDSSLQPETGRGSL